jgi:hypothetical protein
MIMRDTSVSGRYRLLESTRHFALAQLRDSGDEREARARHAAHMLKVFSAALDTWEVVPDWQWIAAFQPDTDNLRSALEWSEAEANWPIHVGLAGCSYRFWIQNQLPAEGLAFAQAAWAHVHEASDEQAAILGLGLSELYRLYRLDYRSLDHLKLAKAQYGAGDDIMKRVQTLMLEGWSHTILLNPDLARAAFAKMDELVPAMPTSKLKARALVLGAVHRWLAGDKLLGRTKLEAGLAMHIATGNTRGYWKSVMLSAEIMHQMGDTREAIDLVLRVLPELRLYANAQEHAGQIDNLCVYYMAIGDYEAARPLGGGMRRAHATRRCKCHVVHPAKRSGAPGSRWRFRAGSPAPRFCRCRLRQLGGWQTGYRGQAARKSHRVTRCRRYAGRAAGHPPGAGRRAKHVRGRSTRWHGAQGFLRNEPARRA